METMISIPESLYNQLLDYFDNRSEMKLLTELENYKQ